MESDSLFVARLRGMFQSTPRRDENGSDRLSGPPPLSVAMEVSLTDAQQSTMSRLRVPANWVTASGVCIQRSKGISDEILKNLPVGSWDDVTPDMLKSIVSLKLSPCESNFISKYDFDGLSNLENLDLSQNGLTNITDSCLLSLPSLKKLNLADNQISSIDETTLSLLDSVKVDLSLNPLSERTIVQLLNQSDYFLNHLKGVSKDRIEKAIERRDVMSSRRLLASALGVSVEHINDSGVYKNRCPSLMVVIPKMLSVSSWDDITPEMLLGIKELDLSIWGIKQLTWMDFIGLENLESLNLSRNRLEEIDLEVLSSLPSLKKLSLNNNRLVTLTDSVISFFADIQVVLEGNPLNQRTINKFLSWSDAFRCSLQGISSLQVTDAKLSMMRKLDVGLEKINDWGVCRRSKAVRDAILQQLPVLSWGEVTPDMLRKIVRLEVVNCQGSSIQDNDFMGLDNLEVLDLSNNGLQTIKLSWLKQLPFLEKLSLVNNDISEICGLTLSYLENMLVDLSQNPLSDKTYKLLLSQPPDLRERLKGLRESRIAEVMTPQMLLLKRGRVAKKLGVHIDSVNSSLVNMARNHVIKKVVLSHLPVRSWDEVTPEMLSQIRSLNLSVWGLKKIEPLDFVGLDNLESLDLSNNNLETLDIEFFSVLPSLKKLFLEGNKLCNIEALVVDVLLTIEVNLERNPLSQDTMDRLYLRSSQFKYTDLGFSSISNALEPLETPPSVAMEVCLSDAQQSTMSRLMVPANWVNASGVCIQRSKAISDEILKTLSVGSWEDVTPDMLKRIVSLKLPPCEYNSISKYDFDGLNSLENLDLSQNGLTDIKGSCLQSLPCLKKLTLANNQISSIDEATFPLLNRLEVDLRLNPLSERTIVQLLNHQSHYFLSHLKGVAEDRIEEAIKRRGRQLFADELGVLVEHVNDSGVYKNRCFALKVVIPKMLSVSSWDDITPEMLLGIKELDLSIWGIKQLTRLDFIGLDNLELLNLSRNELKEIHADVFFSLPSLKKLSLNNNRLVTLTDSVIGFFANIQVMLEGNPFNQRTINKFLSWSDAFRCSPQGVSSLKVTDAKLSMMSKLDIGLGKVNDWGLCTRSKAVSDAILKQLSVLSWDEVTPDMLWQIVRLEVVNCQGSSIQDNDFMGLDNLEVLDLSNNGLQTIKLSWLKQLPFLEILSLVNNDISEISGLTLSYFEDKLVDLSENPLSDKTYDLFLKQPPDFLDHVKGLSESKTMGMRKIQMLLQERRKVADKLGVHIDFVNSSLVNMRRNETFKTVVLSHLPVGSWDEVTPEMLSQIRRLNSSMWGLKKIESLDFIGLDNLESLDLSYNDIETLDAEVFSVLPSLKELFLQGNKLCNIEEPVIDAWSNIGVSLEMNPLSQNTKARICLRSTQFKDTGSGLSSIQMSSAQLDTMRRLQVDVKKVNRSGVFIFRSQLVEDMIFDKLSVASWDEVTPDRLKEITEMNFSCRGDYGFLRDDFDGLENVRYLDLSNNGLSDVEVAWFRAMPSLKKFSIASNSIQMLDQSVIDYFDRVDMTLHGNPLDRGTIEKILGCHPHVLSNQHGVFSFRSVKVKVAILNYHGLDQWEDLTPQHLAETVQIDLSNLQLNGLAEYDLEGLVNLQYLSLRNNDLISLPDNFFDQLPNLRFLDLSGNNWQSYDSMYPALTNENLEINLERHFLVQARIAMALAWNLLTGESMDWVPENDGEAPEVVSLKNLKDIVKFWGKGESSLWDHLMKVEDQELSKKYADLTLFFHKIKVGTDMLRNEQKSRRANNHIKIVLSVLEEEYGRGGAVFLNFCCHYALDGVETCVDRAGFNLILMSIYGQRHLAKYRQNEKQILRLNNDILYFHKVSKFMSELSDLRIVFSVKQSEFVPIKKVFPDGIKITDPYEGSIICEADIVSAEDREKALLQHFPDQYKELGVEEPVEDALLILNKLKNEGKLFVEGIEIVFDKTLSLEPYVDHVLAYLKEYYSDVTLSD